MRESNPTNNRKQLKLDVLICRAVLIKYHRLAGFNSRKEFTLNSGSQRSEIEVWAELGFPETPSPWLVYGHLLSVSSHSLFSVFVSVQFSSSFKAPILLN